MTYLLFYTRVQAEDILDQINAGQDVNYKNETYNAVFYEDVSFEGSEFEEASAFNYSTPSIPLALRFIDGDFFLCYHPSPPF